MAEQDNLWCLQYIFGRFFKRKYCLIFSKCKIVCWFFQFCYFTIKKILIRFCNYLLIYRLWEGGTRVNNSGGLGWSRFALGWHSIALKWHSWNRQRTLAHQTYTIVIFSMEVKRLSLFFVEIFTFAEAIFGKFSITNQLDRSSWRQKRFI